MNTKTFAQLARKILLKGVRDKLRFWGFDAKGQVQDEPQPVPGGYVFRDQAYDDPTVQPLWQSLRGAIQHKGMDAVVEEVAYTWFNRIMAIQILAKNGYEPAQLEFAKDAGRLPLVLQRAQRGTYAFLNTAEKARLQRVVADLARESEAFAILLIGYCHSHTLLKTVFGSIDDYSELLLPDDILAEEGFLNLLNTTDAISDEEYRKVELIGWLYQFYISEKKDEVFAGFKKNKKAEAEDIPAATQIFTPNWIVKYMVQNTVGKIWLDLHPDSPLKANMKYLVEASPKEEVSISEAAVIVQETSAQQGKPLSLFSEQAQEDTTTSPEEPGGAIIREVAQLKLLDPASGSGHILVEGFDLLYDMYLAEHYPPEEAVESILKNNLFGLDIDKRAAQLAQFAVLLKAAAKRPEILKKGVCPKIYAMPEPRPFSRQEVLDFLGKDGFVYADKLSDALHLMQQAQNLGSIMQFDLPEAGVAYITQRWQYFQEAEDLNFYEKTLLPALGAYLPVLLILCNKFEAVVANPPYMGQGNMNGTLKEYVNKHYPISKADLMTVFIELSDNLLIKSGAMGMVTIQSWMFLSSFEELRKFIITNRFIQTLIQIGYNSFPELNSKVVQACAFVIGKKSASNEIGLYVDLNDVSQSADKHKLFLKKIKQNDYYQVFQSNFSKIPGSPIAYWISEGMVKLFNSKTKITDKVHVVAGISTGANSEFICDWFEVDFNEINFNKRSPSDKGKYTPHNKGGESRKWYGNISHILKYNDSELYKMSKKEGFRYDGKAYFFLPSISWGKVTSSGNTFRLYPEGFTFDSAGISVFSNEKLDYFLLAFLNTNLSRSLLKVINPTLNASPGVIKKLPYPSIVDEHGLIAFNIKININNAKKDWDSRETSWDFQKSPLFNDQPNLRTAYDAWQTEVSNDFFQLHTNEEELNRIFIEIYGLQDELTPEVPLKDVTILQEELKGKDLEALEPQFRSQGAAAVALPIQKDVVMQQFLSYLVGLWMGRYRLDKPGLHIAHPGPTAEEIASYRYNGHDVDIDEDAILPLMGTACEFPDDALQRVKYLLDVIWGVDTRTDNLNFLQECLNSDLEKYLVKQFWKDHCRRYKKKPIYWLFSSPGGAFSVLVYMHRMNAFTAERIRDKYLLPHIKHLRGKVQLLESRTALLSSAEARELDGLRKNLAECETYEMHLKTVADNQIVFDLDDGVTENYKLFKGVVAEIK